MTIHDRVQELMMSLAVDEISSTDRELAEHHLTSCARCRAELDSFTALVPLLSQLEGPGPAHRPRRGRPSRAVERQRRRRRRTWAGAATALLAVALLVSFLVIDRPTTEPRAEVRLTANGAFSDGIVRFEELDDGVIVQLRLSGLSELPPGGMYEAWLEVTAGGVMSLGSFSPNGTGEVSVTLHGAGHLADFGELIVTIEPDMADPALNGRPVVETDLPGR